MPIYMLCLDYIGYIYIYTTNFAYVFVHAHLCIDYICPHFVFFNLKNNKTIN